VTVPKELEKSLPTRRRPTLRDVGELAGVDSSIASRVLAGDLKRVGDATRERILDAALQLGWRPHPAAKSLRTGRTTTLALIVPNIQNPAYGSMIEGAQNAAFEADHVLVLADTQSSRGRELDEVQRISRHVDGMIIASARTNGLSLDEIHSTLVPTVLLNRRGIEGLPAVLGPDERGAEMAAEHLWDLGHRQMAIITGPTHIDTAVRRLESFANTLARLGAEPVLVRSVELDVASAAVAALELLSLPRDQRPTAIFGAALTAALGSMVAARDLHIEVPSELSIIGLDDAQVAELVTPALTTIRMPHRSMGAAAVNTLLRMIEGADIPETESVPDPPILMVRGTSALVRSEFPEG